MSVNMVAGSDTIVLFPTLEYQSLECETVDSVYLDANNGYFNVTQEIK
ncbi:MAG: hypothetical protein JEZ09_13435 [Salinivirgaceae bacterium]|nr:hypothetical protein [Salinivirgaceae bacterium]